MREAEVKLKGLFFTHTQVLRKPLKSNAELGKLSPCGAFGHGLAPVFGTRMSLNTSDLPPRLCATSPGPQGGPPCTQALCITGSWPRQAGAKC